MPLYNPRQDKWDRQFAWNEEYTLVVGLTPTGRATVEKLQLNRKGVEDLRRILHTAGEHPPSTDLGDWVSKGPMAGG